MGAALSLIVNSVDDRRFRFFQACFAERLKSAEIEVVRIGDARSMAEGYNRGASRAEADWLIFCHDDIALVSDDPVGAIHEAMAASDVFGVCGTCRLTSGNWYDSGVPHTFGAVVAPLSHRPWERELQVFGLHRSSLVHGAQAIDGILIACHRRVFDQLDGFDENNFPRFVGYDIDFSYRAFLAGWRVAIQTRILLLHLSTVGNFSAEKHREWSESQATLQARFGSYFHAQPGARGHVSLPVLGFDPVEAARMLQAVRNSNVALAHTAHQLDRR